MSSLRNLALAASLCLALPSAFAGQFADVQVIDRDTGEQLRQYPYRGRNYVAGTPGHRYEVQLRNQTRERLLAVMSVDGVNVLTGDTAGTEQGGYVFAPYEYDSVRGWRKSLNDIAQFHFTALPNSYAARTGRPDNVGVIGVALYRELQQRPQRRYQGPFFENGDESDGRYEKSAPQAPSANGSARDRGEESESAQDASPQASRKAAPKLGTGHGQSEYDPTSTTTFQRASSQPEEVITIYYDSRENLAAQGIIPKKRRSYGRRYPDAFPGGFVPDP